jgi:hypothetical protein
MAELPKDKPFGVLGHFLLAFVFAGLLATVVTVGGNNALGNQGHRE